MKTRFMGSMIVFVLMSLPSFAVKRTFEFTSDITSGPGAGGSISGTFFYDTDFLTSSSTITGTTSTITEYEFSPGGMGVSASGSLTFNMVSADTVHLVVTNGSSNDQLSFRITTGNDPCSCQGPVFALGIATFDTSWLNSQELPTSLSLPVLATSSGNFFFGSATGNPDSQPQNVSQLTHTSLSTGPVFNSPVVTNPGSQSNTEGDSVSLQIEASDPDGDSLTYSATGLPLGLSISLNSGLITGELSLDSAGDYAVTVSVSDGTLSRTVEVEWVVEPALNPPVVTNPGPQFNTEGDSVSLQIEASDPDGDSLTYSATGLPPGLSITSNSGLITGELGLDTVGNYAVTVSVSDETLSSSVDFDWVVGAGETVLIAIFMNGNNAFFNSRVYLWNSSENAGGVTASAYTLPRSGPSTLLGTVQLGLLDARSSRNIKIAEDILSSLNIPLPYTADGGNLTVEFTIGANKVQGVAQVFSNSLAFGTYPLQQISPTVNASPTILTANFMNGNNAFLNARVYLWNASENTGSIRVKVYTLPRSGPSTLLGSGSLGLLSGRSSRNIKIAEDILSSLNIPLPYTADGGNLTVEFTVEAENVHGVAQVFSSDLAFGTYPMQVIP